MPIPAGEKSFRPWPAALGLTASILATIILSNTCGAASTSSLLAERFAKGWLQDTKSFMGAPVVGRFDRVVTYGDSTSGVMYHVVFLKPQGLLVLPGDDMVEPVIAYLPSATTYDPSPGNPLGALVEGDVPNRVRFVREPSLLKTLTLAKEFTQAKEKWQKYERTEGCKPEGMANPLLTISRVIREPLVKSTWDQLSEHSTGDISQPPLYNYYSPRHYHSGCVATAMAQIMRFWQYPDTNVGRHSFTIKVDGAAEPRETRGGDGDGGTYQWTDMPLNPTPSSISQDQEAPERKAIGSLTYDSGLSVQMSYSSSGSGASLGKSKGAFLNTFKYKNASSSYVSSGDIPANSRNNMINPNLDAGCPVLLGIKGGDGHAVACDGYGYDGATIYHHINLGWGGTHDGWYSLPDIRSFNSIDTVVYNIFKDGAKVDGSTMELISGRILDQLGKPIVGATVKATAEEKTYNSPATDINGVYSLRVYSYNNYSLEASFNSCMSFSPKTISVLSSDDNLPELTANKWGQDISGESRYLISPSETIVNGSGGQFIITVSSGTGCSWNSESKNNWISILSGSLGSGNGQVTYKVSPNISKFQRNGVIVVAGHAFEVTQTPFVPTAPQQFLLLQ